MPYLYCSIIRFNIAIHVRHLLRRLFQGFHTKKGGEACFGLTSPKKTYMFFLARMYICGPNHHRLHVRMFFHHDTSFRNIVIRLFYLIPSYHVVLEFHSSMVGHAPKPEAPDALSWHSRGGGKFPPLPEVPAMPRNQAPPLVTDQFFPLELLAYPPPPPGNLPLPLPLVPLT